MVEEQQDFSRIISSNPLKVEFLVHKLDKSSKKMYNSAGEPVYEKYIYSFAELGANRKLMGRKFFFLSSKNFANPPKEPNDIEIITDRITDLKGFSAILIKVLDNGEYELYNPATTQLSNYVFDNIGKSENDWDNLLKVQEDFFLKVRLVSNELMMQSNSITNQLMTLMQKAAVVSEKTGIQQQETFLEVMELILDKALTVNTNSTQASTTSIENSTLTNITEMN